LEEFRFNILSTRLEEDLIFITGWEEESDRRLHRTSTSQVHFYCAFDWGSRVLALGLKGNGVGSKGQCRAIVHRAHIERGQKGE
jgi:hypothetical protein